MFKLSCGALAFGLGLLSANLPTTRAIHNIRINTLYRDGFAARGAVIEVRINGHAKPLRLLFDTGAPEILLWSKVAERFGLTHHAKPLTIRGVNGEPHQVRTAVAKDVQIGDLTLHSVPVRIVSEAPLDQMDGIIGANVFRDFLIEIDAPRNKIRLFPLEEDTPEEAAPFVEVGHLLFLEADCNDREIGYALFDTGASYSAIDSANATSVNGPYFREFIQIRGITGEVQGGAHRLSPVRFEIGSSHVSDRQPVAMDLSGIRQRNGIDVRAIIGFPALTSSVVRLNYRTKTIRVVPPPR
jgi:predicted aspartyl protease